MSHATRFFQAAATAGLLIALGACAVSGSPQTDERFGQAVRRLNAQQQIDPGAAQRHGDKASMVEGRVARDSADAYQESYRNPPPTSLIPLIGVSTGTAGGGSR
jgi:Ni,Fe-hydrogenase III small subunit